MMKERRDIWWGKGNHLCASSSSPLVQLVEIKAKIADSKGEWEGGGGEEMMPENSDIPFADAESIKNVRSHLI